MKSEPTDSLAGLHCWLWNEELAQICTVFSRSVSQQFKCRQLHRITRFETLHCVHVNALQLLLPAIYRVALAVTLTQPTNSHLIEHTLRATIHRTSDGRLQTRLDVMGRLGVDHLVVESWTFREAATHGASHSWHHRSSVLTEQMSKREGWGCPRALCPPNGNHSCHDDSVQMRMSRWSTIPGGPVNNFQPSLDTRLRQPPRATQIPSRQIRRVHRDLASDRSHMQTSAPAPPAIMRHRNTCQNTARSNTRHLHEIGMDEEAIRKPSRFSDALQLLVSVTAIRITNGTNHHQLRFGVRLQHPLRNISNVVHPLLFHPSSKEHKKTTSISKDILPETVLLLHRQLCVAPHRQELSFRQVRKSRPLFLLSTLPQVDKRRARFQTSRFKETERTKQEYIASQCKRLDPGSTQSAFSSSRWKCQCATRSHQLTQMPPRSK